MKQKQLITYLNISRMLMTVLIFAQIATFAQIISIHNQIETDKLNAQICAEEIIPEDTLEVIPLGEGVNEVLGSYDTTTPHGVKQ